MATSQIYKPFGDILRLFGLYILRIYNYSKLITIYNYLQVYTMKNSLIMCMCLWVVSFMLELPNFVGWGDHVFDNKTLSCVWDRTADFSYTLFFATVGVVFPVVLISICYLKIYLYVKQQKRKVRNNMWLIFVCWRRAQWSSDSVLDFLVAGSNLHVRRENFSSLHSPHYPLRLLGPI